MRRLALMRPERVKETTAFGFQFAYPSKSEIGRAVARGGTWSVPLDAILGRLPPDPVIAEVGANIGATLLQMERSRPDGEYICFEPSPRFVATLRENIARNKWGNVRIESALVAATPGTRQLFDNNTTASVAAPVYGGHEFVGAHEHESVTLDHYFADSSRLDLLKIDTDGYDFDVLVGAEHVLRTLRPVLLFEFAPFLLEQAGRDPAAVHPYLSDLRYGNWTVYSPTGELLARDADSQAALSLCEVHKYVDVEVMPGELA